MVKIKRTMKIISIDFYIIIYFNLFPIISPYFSIFVAEDINSHYIKYIIVTFYNDFDNVVSKKVCLIPPLLSATCWAPGAFKTIIL